MNRRTHPWDQDNKREAIKNKGRESQLGKTESCPEALWMADRLFGVILGRLPDLQAWENVGGGDRDAIQQKPPFDIKDDWGTPGRHRWDYETGGVDGSVKQVWR